MVVPATTQTILLHHENSMESLPDFHEMVYQQIVVQPDRTKTEVMRNIRQHLSKLKHTVNIICEYLYGISRTKKLSQRGSVYFKPWGLLDLFKFFRVVAENGTNEIWDSVALGNHLIMLEHEWTLHLRFVQGWEWVYANKQWANWWHWLRTQFRGVTHWQHQWQSQFTIT